MSHHQHPLKNCLSRLATLMFHKNETGNSILKIVVFSITKGEKSCSESHLS